MTSDELTGKDRRHLRALAHDLKPVVQIGHQGLSASVVSAIDQALATHELVKVKVSGESEEGLDALGLRMAAATRSQLAQVIGHTLLLFRRRKNKPKVLLPGERPPPEKKTAGLNLRRAAKRAARPTAKRAARPTAKRAARPTAKRKS